ncbi:MAG: NYN domain-containing protein [Clostridia bacterium]|nr:NYN domain-containing protein [Clostridia bacterium]MDD4047501.1 NYN domain-containing protein [Clostridia bacterium]
MRNDETIWLIDAAYLFNAQRSAGHDYNFDYLKLRNKLEEDGKISRVYYLNSTQNPPTDAQNSFHSWLKTARPEGPQFIVKLYNLKSEEYWCPNCQRSFNGQVQKGVDVGIATLIVKLAHQKNYDNLILSSGDGDLEDSIAYVKEYLQKRIELCVFKGGVSPDLQSYADRVYWINDFMDSVSK